VASRPGVTGDGEDDAAAVTCHTAGGAVLPGLGVPPLAEQGDDARHPDRGEPEEYRPFHAAALTS
jgi:hypothetical protein